VEALLALEPQLFALSSPSSVAPTPLDFDVMRCADAEVVWHIWCLGAEEPLRPIVSQKAKSGLELLETQSSKYFDYRVYLIRYEAHINLGVNRILQQ